MYHTPNRIYCSDYHKPYVDVNYTNHSNSQGHINNVRKNRYILSSIDSMIVETHTKKKDIDANSLVDKIRIIYEKKIFIYTQ